MNRITDSEALISDCVDTHVDLESHCTHMSEGLFSHDAAYICLRMISDDGAGLLRDQIEMICRFFLVSV